MARKITFAKNLFARRDALPICRTAFERRIAEPLLVWTLKHNLGEY